MLLKRASERAYRSNCARRPEVGDRFSPDLCKRLLAEEYEKLRNASNRDVHDSSKNTTLPIAREIVEAYVTNEVKFCTFPDRLIPRRAVFPGIL
ncbi:MAG: hypothetical protein HYS12_06735 [Planctomycetes bacterium]|nr:hypothetical protein [Planctomycetota bacterium]